MPFTNPIMRVYFVILGLDLLRGRSRYVGVMDDADINELRQFDLLWNQVRYKTGYRAPDYKMEWEDWFEMNKPGYRMPVSHEQSFNSWMRYFLINKHVYRLRPVQWDGNFEQEMCLNMDLHAPHADHWLSVH